ncbi:hypothetical protein VMCG_06103 [Cytospora schulzeri]|uniref:Uncharacterized protein n=1 Tax=Cytospora schulzeri TaxID=448051 RepID=A0A423WGF4_9PEZI|nr:hypothetical protein VMCG_06103 [Valsa malicola]
MAGSQLAVFDQLVTKGRALHADLLHSVRTNGHRYIKLPEISPFYTTRLDLPHMPGLPESRKDNLRMAGHPADDYVLAQVENVGVPAGQPPYQNYVHKNGRAILCIYNFAASDQLLGTSARMYWPDLMAVAISRVMASSGGDPKSLEAIWRMAIIYYDTLSVIRDAMARRQIPEWGWVDIQAGEDDFFALLATDNGKGNARMLAAYPQMFGRKTISRVRVFNNQLCWFLEEMSIPEPSAAAPEASSTPSRKERRRLKRQSLASGSTADLPP